jgi:BlaI family penicillinase repressor
VTNSNTQGRPLTDLQQAILDVVWSRGPVTAEQVRTALGPARHLKDSTVRTLLRRLEVRGFLAHSLSGKGVAARAVQHIIDRFWAGSTEQFLAGMVSEKVLSIDEIRQLARKVKAHR